jgi:diaminobutyrate-2-oxoglutarate transaminase
VPPLSRGGLLLDEHGREYVDFFAGAFPYGHAPTELHRALLEYFSDGVPAHDSASAALHDFVQRFEEVVLQPRGLRYRAHFPGPTATHAIASALQLARSATGRTAIVGFTNGAHGTLTLTSGRKKRMTARASLPGVHIVPFDGFWGPEVDTLELLEQMLEDPSSGLESPAAFLLETVQRRGGVNAASAAWLCRLAALARRLGAWIIVDENQAGCGRTGSFFSFDGAGIVPDAVCLSEGLSGYGLPLSLVLVRPDHGLWTPGGPCGAREDCTPAFVTAAATLGYWATPGLGEKVQRDGAFVAACLRELASGPGAHARGRGLLQGLVLSRPGLARRVAGEAFRRGLLIETVGPEDEVLLLLPPLNMERPVLEQGLQILADSLHAAVSGDPTA